MKVDGQILERLFPLKADSIIDYRLLRYYSFIKDKQESVKKMKIFPVFSDLRYIKRWGSECRLYRIMLFFGGCQLGRVLISLIKPS